MAARTPRSSARCASVFTGDEELRLLPPCSHAFHTDCIGEWLAGHVTCPVCRCNLDPDQGLAAAEGEVAAEWIGRQRASTAAGAGGG